MLLAEVAYARSFGPHRAGCHGMRRGNQILDCMDRMRFGVGEMRRSGGIRCDTRTNGQSGLARHMQWQTDEGGEVNSNHTWIYMYLCGKVQRVSDHRSFICVLPGVKQGNQFICCHIRAVCLCAVCIHTRNIAVFIIMCQVS
jgi:hypothetical protein